MERSPERQEHADRERRGLICYYNIITKSFLPGGSASQRAQASELGLVHHQHKQYRGLETSTCQDLRKL